MRMRVNPTPPTRLPPSVHDPELAHVVGLLFRVRLESRVVGCDGLGVAASQVT